VWFSQLQNLVFRNLCWLRLLATASTFAIAVPVPIASMLVNNYPGATILVSTDSAFNLSTFKGCNYQNSINFVATAYTSEGNTIPINNQTSSINYTVSLPLNVTNPSITTVNTTT
jgi:hypothetical protein